MASAERPAARAFLAPSPEATEALGESLGRGLGAGAVVALLGELGAGKTTFVRGLARGLEVEEPVTSPTFTLMQEHAGRVPLHHFDAWMAAREEAFLESGGAELLGGEGVAAVEWADRLLAWLPVPRIEVELRHVQAGPGGADTGRREVLVRLVLPPGAPAGPGRGSAVHGPWALAERLARAVAGIEVPAGAREDLMERSPEDPRPGEPPAGEPGAGGSGA